MNAVELKAIVDAQAHGRTVTGRGWDFGGLLVAPHEVLFKDYQGNPLSVWVVLQEEGNGYSVIYDPEEQSFGLATGGVVIGLYGEFLSAVEAM